MKRGKFAWTMQRDALLRSGYWCVICGRSLKVFLRENQWWRRESQLFSQSSISLSTMLESKGRTGTTQTKSWYHLKWKFPSFVLSHASLAFRYSDFVPREPLAVNSPFMRLFSSHIWPTPPLTPQVTLNAYLQNYSGVLTMYGIFSKT